MRRDLPQPGRASKRPTDVHIQALFVAILDMRAVLVAVELYSAELIQRELFRGHACTLGRTCKHNLRSEPLKRYRCKAILTVLRASCEIKSVPTFWVSERPGLRGGPNERERPYFEHLSTLALDMARTGLRGLILSIWAAGPQMLTEWASGRSFGASGQPGPRNERNESPGRCCTLQLCDFWVRWLRFLMFRLKCVGLCRQCPYFAGSGRRSMHFGLKEAANPPNIYS